MTPIQNYDPAERVKAIRILGVGAILAFVALVLVDRYDQVVMDWIVAEPARMGMRARLVFLMIGIVIAVPMLAGSVWMWRMARDVIRGKRFPPEGQNVIRPTRIWSGDSAVELGCFFQVCSGILVAATCLLPVILLDLASMLDQIAGP